MSDEQKRLPGVAGEFLPEFYERVLRHQRGYDGLAYHNLSDSARCAVWSEYADAVREQVAALAASPSGASEDTALLGKLADALTHNGAITLMRATWEEGFTVEMMHRDRYVDAGGEPRPLTIEALRDTLTNIQLPDAARSPDDEEATNG